MSIEIACIFILVLCFAGSILHLMDYRIPLGIGIILIIASFISIAVTGSEEASHNIITLAYFTLLGGVIGCLVAYFRPRAGK